MEKRKQKRAKALWGQDKIDKIHEKGKTARERINDLLDPGTYDAFKLHRCYNFGMEKIKFLGDGIVTATVGSPAGRSMYAQDARTRRFAFRTLAETCKVMDLASRWAFRLLA